MPDKSIPIEQIVSVTEITREIKKLFRESFATQWIEGELSGYKRHGSGHHYFTLKDAGAQLACAMWRSSASRLNFHPEDGMKVQAWGQLDVYEPQGRYQLIVAQMRPAGIGELQKAFEALKQKLQKEGLFDLDHKRPLPVYPNRIGLVTSESGAALQDMKNIAARRWPAAELVLSPVHVQGAGAAEEIAAAIRKFSDQHAVDVIVTGRGGGSLEDLWAFNEAVVAYAIFHSSIPVVSAVGHEVDFTIADLTADLRAPTPSAAMELILPDRREIARLVLEYQARIQRSVKELLRYYRSEFNKLSSHWALREPVNVIRSAAQRTDELQSRLFSTHTRVLRDKQASLLRVRDLLFAYHPQAVLERGYAVVRDSAGNILRSASDAAPASRLDITLARGGLTAEVKEIDTDRKLAHVKS
ncbi:exodeoxyribonuclease VII large subunit [bacterium]|nr:exodeoxyribonuclease VII large subunit [bacterium]MBU1637709.1 exodeoxyribonuclease VII large subunit [bacterium]